MKTLGDGSMIGFPKSRTRTIRFPNSLLDQMRELRRKSGLRLPLIVRKALNASARSQVVVNPWRTTTSFDESTWLKITTSSIAPCQKSPRWLVLPPI